MRKDAQLNLRSPCKKVGAGKNRNVRYPLMTIDLFYGNDCMPEAIETFSLNHPEPRSDARGIEDVKSAQVRPRLGLKKGELDLLVASPPCPGFSINAPARFLNAPPRQYFQGLPMLPRTVPAERFPVRECLRIAVSGQWRGFPPDSPRVRRAWLPCDLQDSLRRTLRGAARKMAPDSDRLSARADRSAGADTVHGSARANSRPRGKAPSPP